MAVQDTSQPVEAASSSVGHADVTRLVRMGLCPPARFAAGADFTLWLTTFEMYVQQAGIAETQRVRELLSLLEDDPFHNVGYQRLVAIVK